MSFIMTFHRLIQELLLRINRLNFKFKCHLLFYDDISPLVCLVKFLNISYESSFLTANLLPFKIAPNSRHCQRFIQIFCRRRKLTERVEAKQSKINKFWRNLLTFRREEARAKLMHKQGKLKENEKFPQLRCTVSDTKHKRSE